MRVNWKARATQLEAALTEAKLWHYSEDKAISKYPPTGDGNWRRMQHREQMDLIEKVLQASLSQANTLTHTEDEE